MEGYQRQQPADSASGRSAEAIEPSADWTAQDWPRWAAMWFMRDRVPRIIVSRGLQVLTVNPRGSEIVAASDLLSICDGQLTATRDFANLRDAVAKATELESTHLLGEAGAGILLTAIASADGPGALVALTLRDISVPVEIDAPCLCVAFGLTRGERSAVLGLLRGQSPRKIADQTGRSVLTVRTHLKRAYGKIGVRSQAQLFTRLLPYTSMRAAAR